ncbi:MAG: alpha-L-fucosidase, partial [Mucinivorans sp.]
GHLRWHDYEQTMFIHFAPTTWQVGREYDNHSTDLKRMRLDKMNTDQWCEVALSWGARQIMFVAKHTGGFCWWPTSTTDYSVKSIPWKDGNGDLLKEISRSCRKYGLDLGIYVYSGDDQWGAGIGSGGITKDPSKQAAYNEIYRTQLTEVLSNYGKITEIWFDGGCQIPVEDIIFKYAPDAVVFGGHQPHPAIRWVGNEDGYAPYPNWYVAPGSGIYAPFEVDVPFLKNNGHKWFWSAGVDHLMMTIDQFVERYYASVGRGAVLLLNSTPDTTGLIPASHVARYKEFGQELARRFAIPLAVVTVPTILFDTATVVNHVVIQEDLTGGQRVQGYRVMGLIEDGSWVELCSGTSVGHKRIDYFDDQKVKALRLEFTKSIACPSLKSFAAYEVENMKHTANEAYREPERSVGAWNFGTTFSQYTYDLTKFVSQIGIYEIEFRRISGDGGVRVKNPQLTMYGGSQPSLVELVGKGNVVRITRSQQTLDEFPTILKLDIQQSNLNAVGQISIRRITFN